MVLEMGLRAVFTAVRVPAVFLLDRSDNNKRPRYSLALKSSETLHCLCFVNLSAMYTVSPVPTCLFEYPLPKEPAKCQAKKMLQAPEMFFSLFFKEITWSCSD